MNTGSAERRRSGRIRAKTAVSGFKNDAETAVDLTLDAEGEEPMMEVRTPEHRPIAVFKLEDGGWNSVHRLTKSKVQTQGDEIAICAGRGDNAGSMDRKSNKRKIARVDGNNSKAKNAHVKGPTRMGKKGKEKAVYSSDSMTKWSRTAKDGEGISPYWWGNKYGFISGGFLGAQSRIRKSSMTEDTQNPNERTAFHEDDQENLYNLVQDKATSGKQGLGIKGQPRKVAGVRFQGKRTSFSDDEEGSDDEDCHPSAKRKFDDISETKKDVESKPKLKKLCKKLLSQVPDKSLKLKQLKGLVDKHCSILSNFSSKKDALAFLRKKLEGSETFTVEGKKVRLLRK